MKHFSLIFALTLFIVVSSSCDNEDEPVEPDDKVSLELISKNTFGYSIEVTPTIVSVELVETNDLKYYVFNFTIGIKNTGSTSLDFNSNTVQSYLVSNNATVGAGGTQIADIHLDPDGTFKITQSANSSVLSDPSLIDHLKLQIYVYKNNSRSDLVVLLEYLITIKA